MPGTRHAPGLTSDILSKIRRTTQPVENDMKTKFSHLNIMQLFVKMSFIGVIAFAPLMPSAAYAAVAAKLQDGIPHV